MKEPKQKGPDNLKRPPEIRVLLTFVVVEVVAFGRRGTLRHRQPLPWPPAVHICTWRPSQGLKVPLLAAAKKHSGWVTGRSRTPS
jgi:hypothetical protein